MKVFVYVACLIAALFVQAYVRAHASDAIPGSAIGFSFGWLFADIARKITSKR